MRLILPGILLILLLISCSGGDEKVVKEQIPIPDVEITASRSSDIIVDDEIPDTISVKIKLINPNPEHEYYLKLVSKDAFCWHCNQTSIYIMQDKDGSGYVDLNFSKGVSEIDWTITLPDYDNVIYEPVDVVNFKLVEITVAGQSPSVNVEDKQLGFSFPYVDNDEIPMIGFEPYGAIDEMTVDETYSLDLDEEIISKGNYALYYYAKFEFSGTATEGKDYQRLAPDSVRVNTLATTIKLFKVIDDKIPEGSSATDNEYIDVTIKPIKNAVLGNADNSEALRTTLRYYINDSEDN